MTPTTIIDGGVRNEMEHLAKVVRLHFPEFNRLHVAARLVAVDAEDLIAGGTSARVAEVALVQARHALRCAALVPGAASVGVDALRFLCHLVIGLATSALLDLRRPIPDDLEE